MAQYFPEMLAMLTFVPVGMFMGHMMNFVNINEYTITAYRGMEYWPFFIGGMAAVLTGTVHMLIKHIYKQYKYEHMYFQMVGLILLLITTIFLKGHDLLLVAFIGFVAHGIICVSALSYINIRMAKSKYRFLKLSIPHFLYLIGVSLGATLTWLDNQFIFDDTLLDLYRFNGLLHGIVLIAITVFLLFLFIFNEGMQLCMQSYNYKESLDNDINRENMNKEIFKDKYFHITQPHLSYPQIQLPFIPLETRPNGAKEIGRILYTLASKVLSMMIFYYPFLYVHVIAALYSSERNIFLVHWFTTGGILISLILMAIVSYKINYFLTIGIKILCMIMLLLIFSTSEMYWYDTKIVLWIVFVVLGFGFSHPDINILSYTNLKFNEVVLGIGYFIELVIIGVMQYETVLQPENVFGRLEDFDFMFTHTLIFIMILTCVGIHGKFVITRGNHSSLLEIKNILNNCANINYLVYNGNYGGQQNPQQPQNYPQIASQVPPMSYNQSNTGYGQPQYPQQQQYFPQPNHPPQYEQSPYFNMPYPNQMSNNATNSFNNQNLSRNYSQQENQPTMPPPLMGNSYASAPPSQYNQNIARPVFPLGNPKYAIHS